MHDAKGKTTKKVGLGNGICYQLDDSREKTSMWKGTKAGGNLETMQTCLKGQRRVTLFHLIHSCLASKDSSDSCGTPGTYGYQAREFIKPYLSFMFADQYTLTLLTSNAHLSLRVCSNTVEVAQGDPQRDSHNCNGEQPQPP